MPARCKKCGCVSCFAGRGVWAVFLRERKRLGVAPIFRRGKNSPNVFRVLHLHSDLVNASSARHTADPDYPASLLPLRVRNSDDDLRP